MYSSFFPPKQLPPKLPYQTSRLINVKQEPNGCIDLTLKEEVTHFHTHIKTEPVQTRAMDEKKRNYVQLKKIKKKRKLKCSKSKDEYQAKKKERKKLEKEIKKLEKKQQQLVTFNRIKTLVHLLAQGSARS